MSFAADFPELLVDSVIWRPVTGWNDFGEPSTWGTTQTLPAMIEHKVQLIRTPQGTEVATRGQVTVSGIPGIRASDEVTLVCPALPTLDGEQPGILDVAPVRDYDRAAYLTRVMF